jgi:hypothetical protein
MGESHLPEFNTLPYYYKAYKLHNKTSCFECIKFITEDTKVKHTNITTKLQRKVFTNVIKKPTKRLGFDRQSLFKSARKDERLIENGVEKLS